MTEKQIRQGTRLQVTNELKKLDDASITAEKLEVVIQKLHLYYGRLPDMDRNVFAELQDSERQTEIESSANYNDYVLEQLLKAQQRLKSMSNVASASDPNASVLSQSSASPSGPSNTSNSIKLPTFQLPKFDGNYLKWQCFWEAYRSAVHENSALSDSQRFYYLRMHLTGEAFALVDGYSPTEANYAQVIQVLNERFGDKQRATFAHLEAMLAIPPATTHAISELQHVSDQCDKHIRSLVALGLSEETFSVVFAPIMLSKIPRDVKTEICRKNGQQEWKLANIRMWLKEEIVARDIGQSSFGGSSMNRDANRTEKGNMSASRYPTKPGNRYQTTTSTLVVNEGAKSNQPGWSNRYNAPRTCVFCNMAGHAGFSCRRVPDAESRKQVLFESYRCFHCFSTQHKSPTCDRKRPCMHCSGMHNAALCPKKYPSPQKKPQGKPNSKSTAMCAPHKQSEATASKTTTGCAVAIGSDGSQHGNEVAFLPTAVTEVQNTGGNRTHTARLLMDTASSRSFITNDLCNRLGLVTRGTSHMSVGRFGSSTRSTSTTRIVELAVKCKDGTVQQVKAHVTPLITCPIARSPIDRERFPVVEQIPLAEPLNDLPDSLPLDILIGSDHYYKFVPSASTIQCDGGPVFVSSRLGFLTAGTMLVSEDTGPESTLVLLLTEAAPGRRDGLDRFAVERFWQLEEVGTKGTKEMAMEISDEEAIQKFEDTVQFRDKRYYVKLPYKVENPDLPDNYKLAYGRLRSVHNRLQQKPELLQTYHDIIRKQLEAGIVEVAPQKQSGLVYYVPHHEVLTPLKTTTKMRMVFDASSKIRKDALSLNDCLHRGLVILDDLCGLLMRFRLHKIGLVSDIEKAFLQVRLQESDRGVGSFLWLKDPNKPPDRDNLVVYRFTSVFFGAVASPFLLGATIDYHLRQFEDPVACQIRKNLYVDNVIAGADTIDETVHFYQRGKELFLGCSMNLREFHTNSTDVAKEIPACDRGESSEPSVLGVKWRLVDDTLHCKGPKVLNKCVVTKRLIVKQVAQVYDPCGWFAPITVSGKMLIQELWKQKVEWDTPVSSDVELQWERIRAELQLIPEYAVPRHIGSSDPAAQLQLHVFCDASGKAASPVVYLRKNSDTGTTSDLLFAKSRLAPIDPVQTIPRLELVAVKMGVDLLVYVEKQLRLPVVKKCVWSDSQCVLQWLIKDKLATSFVRHRIEEIKRVPDLTFRYVRSGDNPADMPSRGCTFASLNDSLWWHGPEWLLLPEEQWPTEFPPSVSASEVAVTESSNAEVQMVAPEITPDPLFPLEKHSSLQKVLRVTSYIKRFGQSTRTTPACRQIGCLRLKELAGARLHWERYTQRMCFPSLVSAPSSKLEREAKKLSLSQLNVFRDHQGILRCQSRLEFANLTYDSRNPILLPKSDPFTDLVIRMYHTYALHAGVTQTLTEVRNRYWVIHGRSQVKRAIRECRRCTRVNGGPYQVPVAPPLPEFRVAEQAPFAYTGLDYLGPLHVKVDRQAEEAVKIWVCLFTCALIRAVHLEVVEDQTADEFHLCLRRFFALRGTPSLIISDNASQFLPVLEAMKRMGKEVKRCSDELPPETIEFLTSHNVEWKFIPQKSPWMGGFYERMIGTVKTFLKKSLDGLCVTRSELRTVIAEISAVVNSRPLLYVEEDIGSVQLCPADFLGKTRKPGIPTFDERNVPDSYDVKTCTDAIIGNWKRLQAISTNFWELWRQGYLTSLRQKHANAAQRNPSLLRPAVGSVVQIKDPKLPRCRWRLGTVTKLIRSKDDEIRVVILRLANGRSVTRPIRLLYPIEPGPALQTEQNPKNQSSDTVATPDEVPSADRAVGGGLTPPMITRKGGFTRPLPVQGETGLGGSAVSRPKRSASIKAKVAIANALSPSSEGSDEDL